MIRINKHHSKVDWFDSKNLDKDLKAKSIKGGISTSLSQFIRFGLSLVSTFVLARMLLPEDFGLVGMVTAFTGLANIIQDMGLSTAVIQKEKITHHQVSNLFWINILICCVIGCLFALFSPLIVSLYHQDSRLYPIILSYAAGIAIGGFAIQHNALMNRKMFFTDLAKVNILATLCSVICGIIAALAGLGFWSIVILNISANIFNACFMWFLCDWRPSFPVKKQRIRDFVQFGAGISGFNIINYFSRYSDDILIGHSLGAIAVGFYSKAYQLLMLPINQLRTPLMTVAIPAMSKLQNEPDRYVNYYRKYIFLLAFFSMPLVACLAVFSKELIIIVLGRQWLPSSSIFMVLAIAGFIQPVSSSSGLVMISTGQTKKFFIIGCISSALIVLGFFIGIRWGVIGTAVSLVITTYLLIIPVLHFAFKTTPLKITDFFQEISLPVLHTVVMCAFLIVARMTLKNVLPDILTFICISPLGMVFYYFSWKLYTLGRHKLSTIDYLTTVILQKLRKKSSNNANAFSSVF
jgi:PST family polysaccharide transporter